MLGTLRALGHWCLHEMGDEARYHRTEIGDTGVQYFTPTFGILF